MKKIFAVTLMVLSVLYLLNPTAGVFELLPDALPIVGNIDELFAFYVLAASLHYYKTGNLAVYKKILKR